jgi:alpha-1,3-rhamnosyl/mannosyltransferase
VIASTAKAVSEIAGQQAHLLDPQDSDGWRTALGRVVTDDDWWRSLRQGAEAKARPFTWERCAAETLQVYRQLCATESLPVPAIPSRRAG